MFTRRVLAFFPIVFALALASRAGAETFHCTTHDPGCIIASMAKANANGPDHDYLYLDPGTYLLQRSDNGHDPLGANGTGLPVNTGALTIVGGGTGVTLLARNQQAPAFRLLRNGPTGGLTLAYLTLAWGEMGLDSGSGGCIHNQGSMMLIEVVVRECAAGSGGGIINTGELLLIKSYVLENFAEAGGGGIFNLGLLKLTQRSWIGENVAGYGGCIATRGQLIIDNSVIDGCVATLIDGGGIDMLLPFQQQQQQIQITNSLVSENFAAARGGGIAVQDSETTIVNSTVWENVADGDGGGLYVNGGTATLTDVAVLYNSAGLVDSDPRGRVLGPGIGGGVKTVGEGIAILERSWLLFNQADAFPECEGNIQLRDWNVIGTPNQFHPPGQPPCQ